MIVNRVAILVLQGYPSWKPTMLINSAGKQQEVTCLDKGTFDIVGSCSTVWKNQLHIFGGNVQPRQIVRLSSKKLKTIGSLLFDHVWGSCNVMADNFIYLCFNAATDADVSDSKPGCSKIKAH